MLVCRGREGQKELDLQLGCGVGIVVGHFGVECFTEPGKRWDFLTCRMVTELKETLQARNEEGEAYISEIEVRGSVFSWPSWTPNIWPALSCEHIQSSAEGRASLYFT